MKKPYCYNCFNGWMVEAELSLPFGKKCLGWVCPTCGDKIRTAKESPQMSMFPEQQPKDFARGPKVAKPSGVDSETWKRMVGSGAAFIHWNNGDPEVWEQRMLEKYPQSVDYLEHLFAASMEYYQGMAADALKNIAHDTIMPRFRKDWEKGVKEFGQAVDWYAAWPEVVKFCQGDEDKAKHLINFLAMTSAHTGLELGVLMATRAYAQMLAGVPFQDVTGKPMLEQYMQTGDWKGVKTHEFAQNMFGNPDSVTIDIWMMRFFGIDRNPTASEYEFYAEAIRHAAREMEVAPATLQAVVWTVARSGATGDPGKPIAEVLKDVVRQQLSSGMMTPEMLGMNKDKAEEIVGKYPEQLVMGEEFERTYKTAAEEPTVQEETVSERPTQIDDFYAYVKRMPVSRVWNPEEGELEGMSDVVQTRFEGYPLEVAQKGLSKFFKGNEGFVINDEKGNVVALVALHQKGTGPIIVDQLVSDVKGGGTRLMLEAATEAYRKGVGLVLYPAPTAEAFYKGLGMHVDPDPSTGHRCWFTADEVEDFVSRFYSGDEALVRRFGKTSSVVRDLGEIWFCDCGAGNSRFLSVCHNCRTPKGESYDKESAGYELMELVERLRSQGLGDEHIFSSIERTYGREAKELAMTLADRVREGSTRTAVRKGTQVEVALEAEDLPPVGTAGIVVHSENVGLGNVYYVAWEDGEQGILADSSFKDGFVSLANRKVAFVPGVVEAFGWKHMLTSEGENMWFREAGAIADGMQMDAVVMGELPSGETAVVSYSFVAPWSVVHHDKDVWEGAEEMGRAEKPTNVVRRDFATSEEAEAYLDSIMSGSRKTGSFYLYDPRCKGYKAFLLALRNATDMTEGIELQKAFEEEHLKTCPECQAYTEKHKTNVEEHPRYGPRSEGRPATGEPIGFEEYEKGLIRKEDDPPADWLGLKFRQKQ